MVDPVSIGVVVAALAAKALARVEDEVVDQGETALKRLLGGLKKLLGGSEESGGTELVRLEDAPDSPSRVQELAAAIDARAAAEPELLGKLEELVAEAKRADVSVGDIVQEATGNGIVQISGVSGSTIQVNTSGVDRPQPPAGS